MAGAEAPAAAEGGGRAPHALTLVYGLWAVAALSRALYQYAARRPESLLPTHMSAAAGALYVLIIVGLRGRTPAAYWATLALLAAELAGVLGVGAADVFLHALPYATVWSGFGAGYLYIPLALPAAGIWWMLRPATRRAYGLRARAAR